MPHIVQLNWENRNNYTEDVSLRLYGPGTNVIAGGLSTRYGGDQLWLCEGTAIVSNRQVTLGTTYSGDVPVYGAYSGIREKGRRLVVCNGGSIVLHRPYIASWLVVSGQNDPVLEVATGGTVQFNTAVRFSQSNGSLLVSGGNFNVHGFATGDFSLAESGCNGRVVLSAGTLSLSRPIVQTGTGEFVFDGGKLSLYGGGDEYASWGRNFRYLANGPVVSVTENGGTLDMSGCRSVVTVVTNQLGRKASSAWQGPGTLTVVGAANRDIAFHVNVSTNVDGSAAASTLGLSFRNVPSVTFAGVTEGAVGLDKLDLQDARLASVAVGDGCALALGSVRVRSGLSWDRTLFGASALSVGNLTLDSGAGLVIDSSPTGEVDPLVLSGALNLPDQAVYFVRATAGSKSPLNAIAVTTAKGVVGGEETVWKRAAGSLRGVRPKVSQDGQSLILGAGPGLVIFFR